MDDEAVVFRTRGQDTATVSPTEFIRRFLAHRLPRGFVKIRHGGLLAPTNVNGRLARAKDLLRPQCPPAPADQHDDGVNASEPRTPVADLPWMDLLLAVTDIDLKVCPVCHSRTVVRVPLPPDCRGPPDQITVN